MNRYFRKYSPICSVLAFAVFAACSDSDPASPAAPSATQAAAVTVEPAHVDPEFLPGGFCAAHRPFRGTVVVVVGGFPNTILRGVHFNFIDRFGGRTAPIVVPADTGSGVMTSVPGSPVPIPGYATIPGSSPIPIPGSTPIEGVLFGGNTFRRLPFTFEFGCGVPASGTLVIRVETADTGGTWSASEAKVKVGG